MCATVGAGGGTDTKVPISGTEKLMRMTPGSKGPGFQVRFQPCWLCACHLYKVHVSLGLGILFFPK